MEGGDFTDTRLYISVRPFLEYEIPEVGLVVYRAILGDVPSERAFAELDRLSNTPLCRVDAVPVPTTGGDVGDLNSHCVRVVNYAIEHVRRIEREWIDFLRRVANGMRQEARSIRHDIRDVRGVYERYRAVHPRIAEREYRNEMHTLHTRLDGVIDTYRRAETPIVSRSDVLKQSTHELRESFACAYGREDTTVLMKLRQHFEGELATAQTDIVASFCRHCRDLLGGA